MSRKPQKRTWILSELFHPERASTGRILTSIAEGLAGHMPVGALTIAPTYSSRDQRPPAHEVHCGIEIHRGPASRFNKDFLPGRVLNMLTLSLSLLCLGLWHVRRGERILVVTNPPLLPFIAWTISKVKGASCILLVHDVYPDAIVAAGFAGRRSLIIRMMDSAMAWIVPSMAQIIALGRDMRALLSQKYPSAAARIRIIPNWASTDLIHPLPTLPTLPTLPPPNDSPPRKEGRPGSETQQQTLPTIIPQEGKQNPKKVDSSPKQSTKRVVAPLPTIIPPIDKEQKGGSPLPTILPQEGKQNPKKVDSSPKQSTKRVVAPLPTILPQEGKQNPKKVDSSPKQSTKRVAAPLPTLPTIIAQYAGNLGRTHGVETLLETARLLLDKGSDVPVQISFVGWGAMEKAIRSKIDSGELPNITLHPPWPEEMINESLNACHVAVFGFKPGMKGVSVPSRLYNIMAAGKPIIAAVEEDSEPGLLIREHGLGWVVKPGDAEAFAQALLHAGTLPADELAAMGLRGRALAEREFTYEACLTLWLEALGIDPVKREF